MIKILFVLIFAVNIVIANVNDKDHKVTICHYPPGNPGNPQTISIDKSALETHLSLHGDYEGPCTESPTAMPTFSPTFSPTTSPTNIPSTSPTNMPTTNPTNIPSTSPTNIPSTSPTNIPSTSPTNMPTNIPSTSPTNMPTNMPTNIPSTSPTNMPTNIQTHRCNVKVNRNCVRYSKSIKQCRKDKTCSFNMNYRFQPCSKRNMPCHNSEYGSGDDFGNVLQCNPVVIKRFSKTASTNGCIVLKKLTNKPAVLGCDEAYGGCFRLLHSPNVCRASKGCMVNYKSNSPNDFYCVKYNTNVVYAPKSLKNVYVSNYAPGLENYHFDCHGLPNDACTARKFNKEYTMPETFKCSDASFPGLVVYSENFETMTIKLRSSEFEKELEIVVKRNDICGADCCESPRLYRFVNLFNIGTCSIHIETDGTGLVNPASPYY